MNRYHSLQGHFLSLLRCVAGLLYLEHGTQKMLHFPANLVSSGVPIHAVRPWYILPAGILELVGGTMIIVGFCTRGAAFILSGMMAFAYFMVHAQRAFYPVQNGGDAAILFCFLFLYMSAAGGGSISVDALIGKRAAKLPQD